MLITTAIERNGNNEFITLSNEQQALMREALERMASQAENPNKFMAVVELINIFGLSELSALDKESMSDPYTDPQPTFQHSEI